jgi:hypothetical protein
MIAEQKRTVGLAKPGPKSEDQFGSESEPNYRPTLADAGIDRKLSSRAQKLAAVPEERFEGMLGEWRERVSVGDERLGFSNSFRNGTKINSMQNILVSRASALSWLRVTVLHQS